MILPEALPPGPGLLAGGRAAPIPACVIAPAGAASFAIMSVAMLSGIVTGGNAGSNAALMPIQHALGRKAGLDAVPVAGTATPILLRG